MLHGFPEHRGLLLVLLLLAAASLPVLSYTILTPAHHCTGPASAPQTQLEKGAQQESGTFRPPLPSQQKELPSEQTQGHLFRIHWGVEMAFPVMFRGEDHCL